VGFVVDKVALGHVFSENFGSLANLNSILHSSGAGTIGQKWPQYKGPTPLALKKLCLCFMLRLFCFTCRNFSEECSLPSVAVFAMIRYQIHQLPFLQLISSSHRIRTQQLNYFLAGG
jgi:hypothetical protein